MPINRPSKDDWASPVVGEDPRQPLPASPVRTDPALRLARLFDARWTEVSRAQPELRAIRSSNRGAAVGYLRGVLLAQKGPAHVAMYIEEFMDAVVAGDVRIRDGQFAFERFTTWWGRTVVADPMAPPTTRLVRKQRP